MYNYDSFLMYFYGEKHDFFPLYLTAIPYFLIQNRKRKQKAVFHVVAAKTKIMKTVCIDSQVPKYFDTH